MSNLMKICPVGDELLRADWQTDGRRDRHSAIQNKQNKHINIRTLKQNYTRLMRQSGSTKRTDWNN